MNKGQLVSLIRQKSSYLCVGLDTDSDKLPSHLRTAREGFLDFNKAIIDATRDVAVAYKINTAFYEAMGVKGWELLEATVNYIGPSHLTIADAKRGDIGNTSSQYARAFFEALPFDAITVAPYMGSDSIQPFLEYKNKWTILLGLTSNPGANDFELQQMGDLRLYERVMKTAAAWGGPEQLMFVVGATQAEEFLNIRKICPQHFFLVPGVGAQGGSLKEISEKAMIPHEVGLLVNVSRGVIYASGDKDFAAAAARAAAAYRDEMSGYLGKYA